jgi:hypothetical protein
MTGTNVVLGSVIDMQDVDTNASLEIQITGTPNGTLTLEGSNQYHPLYNTAPTFVPLAAGAANPALPAVAGAALSLLSNLTAQALGCRYVRLRYVNSSSTGVLNAWFHGRGIT